MRVYTQVVCTVHTGFTLYTHDIHTHTRYTHTHTFNTHGRTHVDLAAGSLDDLEAITDKLSARTSPHNTQDSRLSECMRLIGSQNALGQEALRMHKDNSLSECIRTIGSQNAWGL